MSERVEGFEVAGTPVLRIRMVAGTLRVAEGEPGRLSVCLQGDDRMIDHFRIHQRGDTVLVEPDPGRRGRWSRLSVTVESGNPVDLRARVGSCDVLADYPLASLQVEAASGEVGAQRVVGEVRVRAASGAVRLGAVEGDLRVTVVSGDVRVDEAAGDVDITTASGDIEVGGITGGEARFRSASGDVRIGSFERGDLAAKTLSGDVAVAIPPGRTLEVDLDSLSGRVRTEFPVSDTAEGSPGRLAVKSLSGDVVLRSANAR